jgi:DNA-binding CsgD family transcriptional regulator
MTGTEMRTISVRSALECANLVGECTELGDDPAAWQAHLADRADQLIGGCCTAFKILRICQGEPVFDEALLSPRSDDRMRRRFRECLEEGGHKDMPALVTLMPHLYETGALAFRYSDLSGGLNAYYESGFYDRYLRGLGVGDAVMANHAQESQHVLSVMVMRQRSDRPFSSQEEGTLAFLSALLARFVGNRLATRSRAGRPQLAPRVSQTLSALLEGDSEKQIAARLGLQRTTVHGYVRQLYRHYGVRSRGELMARFVRRPASS